MNKLRGLLVGAAIAALATAALAQSKLGFNTWLGNETWEVGIGGPQGQSAFIALSQVRNTTGYQLIGPTPSGTISPTTAVDNLLLNGQPASGFTVNTPTQGTTGVPLTDGQLFAVCNVTATPFAANTATLQAATGQTINGGSISLTTTPAKTCFELQYVLATSTWYQVR